MSWANMTEKNTMHEVVKTSKTPPPPQAVNHIRFLSYCSQEKMSWANVTKKNTDHEVVITKTLQASAVPFWDGSTSTSNHNLNPTSQEKAAPTSAPPRVLTKEEEKRAKLGFPPEPISKKSKKRNRNKNKEIMSDEEKAQKAQKAPTSAKVVEAVERRKSPPQSSQFPSTSMQKKKPKQHKNGSSSQEESSTSSEEEVVPLVKESKITTLDFHPTFNNNRSSDKKSYGAQLADETKQLLERFKENKERTDYKLCFPEITEDLFSSDNDKWALAHCVSEDFAMGKGIAVQFKKRFNNVGDLLKQGTRTGGCAYLKVGGNRYIYYLVTKKFYHLKPLYSSVEQSLVKMREMAEKHGVEQLAMPCIASGLDKLNWKLVARLIDDVFKGSSVKVKVVHL